METQKLSKKDLEKIVLDTSALIHLSDFTSFEQVFTVRGVIEESKDSVTQMKLESLSSQIKVMEPDPASIEHIRNVASTSGDLEKLSETDIDVIALAYQLKCPILTDDYRIQNIAGHANIKFSSIFTPGITHLKGKTHG